MSIEESIARVRTEVELYKQYSEPTPFVKDVEDLLVELDRLKERLREINYILYNPTDDDSPPFRHYGYEEQIRRIKKVCEVK